MRTHLDQTIACSFSIIHPHRQTFMNSTLQPCHIVNNVVSCEDKRDLVEIKSKFLTLETAADKYNSVILKLSIISHGLILQTYTFLDGIDC